MLGSEYRGFALSSNNVEDGHRADFRCLSYPEIA
jgi:hypothetical protein